MKGKGKSKGKGAGADTCIKCGLPGHWAREWWKFPEQNPDVSFPNPSPAPRTRSRTPAGNRAAIEDVGDEA